ncbi:hypothetical protein NPIL_165891 [Nephila pilipes]|uniref:Uncharacterized protein n=1 Tax=Nephila pilipes TaxID=299642 RepID=A0A8X6QXD8_NEPPI|nr:hypothetical protein NPIL_165891 [Nephila pilipes]
MGKVLNEAILDRSPLIPSLVEYEVKITDLWSFDLLGINDLGEKLSKKEAQKLMLKQFEETLSRENDSRYKYWLKACERCIKKLRLMGMDTYYLSDSMDVLHWIRKEDSGLFLWVTKFIDNCKVSHARRSSEMINKGEFDRAEESVLKIVQQEAFTGMEDKRLKALLL